MGKVFGFVGKVFAAMLIRAAIKFAIIHGFYRLGRWVEANGEADLLLSEELNNLKKKYKLS